MPGSILDRVVDVANLWWNENRIASAASEEWFAAVAPDGAPESRIECGKKVSGAKLGARNMA